MTNLLILVAKHHHKLPPVPPPPVWWQSVLHWFLFTGSGNVVGFLGVLLTCWMLHRADKNVKKVKKLRAERRETRRGLKGVNTSLKGLAKDTEKLRIQAENQKAAQGARSKIYRDATRDLKAAREAERLRREGGG